MVGLVRQCDLLGASLSSLVRYRAGSLREVLGTVVIREVMKPPTTVRCNIPLHKAARIMVDRQIDCLLVLEGEALIGLATRTDLLQEMAKR